MQRESEGRTPRVTRGRFQLFCLLSRSRKTMGMSLICRKEYLLTTRFDVEAQDLKDLFILSKYVQYITGSVVADPKRLCSKDPRRAATQRPLDPIHREDTRTVWTERTSKLVLCCWHDSNYSGQGGASFAGRSRSRGSYAPRVPSD